MNQLQCVQYESWYSYENNRTIYCKNIHLRTTYEWQLKNRINVIPFQMELSITTMKKIQLAKVNDVYRLHNEYSRNVRASAAAVAVLPTTSPGVTGRAVQEFSLHLARKREMFLQSSRSVSCGKRQIWFSNEHMALKFLAHGLPFICILTCESSFLLFSSTNIMRRLPWKEDT